MREIEVAVGLTNGTWHIEWVKVEDDAVYLDETLSATAEEMAESAAAKKNMSVSFVKTIYIPEPGGEDRW